MEGSNLIVLGDFCFMCIIVVPHLLVLAHSSWVTRTTYTTKAAQITKPRNQLIVYFFLYDNMMKNQFRTNEDTSSLISLSNFFLCPEGKR